MTLSLAMNPRFDVPDQIFLTDEGYVRSCQAAACGRVFSSGDRVCRSCGHPRPKSCAALLVLGGTPLDHLRIRDILDSEFNSSIFVGRISGRVSLVHPGLWQVDDAEIHMPPAFDVKPISGFVLVAAALRRSGLKVADVDRSADTVRVPND
jgi:hypothetical protein